MSSCLQNEVPRTFLRKKDGSVQASDYHDVYLESSTAQLPPSPVAASVLSPTSSSRRILALDDEEDRDEMVLPVLEDILTAKELDELKKRTSHIDYSKVVAMLPEFNYDVPNLIDFCKTMAEPQFFCEHSRQIFMSNCAVMKRKMRNSRIPERPGYRIFHMRKMFDADSYKHLVDFYYGHKNGPAKFMEIDKDTNYDPAQVEILQKTAADLEKKQIEMQRLAKEEKRNARERRQLLKKEKELKEQEENGKQGESDREEGSTNGSVTGRESNEKESHVSDRPKRTRNRARDETGKFSMIELESETQDESPSTDENDGDDDKKKKLPARGTRGEFVKLEVPVWPDSKTERKPFTWRPRIQGRFMSKEQHEASSKDVKNTIDVQSNESQVKKRKILPVPQLNGNHTEETKLVDIVPPSKRRKITRSGRYTPEIEEPIPRKTRNGVSETKSISSTPPTASVSTRSVPTSTESQRKSSRLTNRTHRYADSPESITSSLLSSRSRSPSRTSVSSNIELPILNGRSSDPSSSEHTRKVALKRKSDDVRLHETRSTARMTRRKTSF